MKIFFRCVSIVLALDLLNVFPASAKSPNTYYYEPSPSELLGRIEWQAYYSQQPPYYEAKDNPPKTNILVLIPDKPINVIATDHVGPNEESFYSVRIMQLYLRDPNDIKKYLGRHVRFFGYFSERTTGFEYTDVLFYAESVTVER